ncbi:hypothetical protein TSUD_58510 [Trifolium subterraneum]|uniref:Uncharacterized protein n=1 Tax=Trifolium subterraneum TaxID=3900 RepID=A0A2Z6MZF8_TRISU|nr:hypothetical protein TSUD_58510 [Trifolium subterraneum]
MKRWLTQPPSMASKQNYGGSDETHLKNAGSRTTQGWIYILKKAVKVRETEDDDG